VRAEPAFRYPIEVPFRDCDLLGHVHHSVYLMYFEQCRHAFWRQRAGAPEHAQVIVAHVECDYRAPARFGDRLEVRLRIGDIGRSSFAFLYEVVNAVSGALTVEGKTVMVAYDYGAGKSTPLSAATRALLQQAGRHTDL
jgi:acyl-CoA thioester hydrolase